MKPIVIDAGHGGQDPGATFRGLQEKEVVLAVALRVEELLLEKGLPVYLTRNEDVFVPLTERCRRANFQSGRLFVSLHCNADPDEDLPGMPEAQGAEVWYFDGSKWSERLAENLGKAMQETFPDEPWRGLKPTTKLAVLRGTIMPAALVELAFIDASESNRELRDPVVQDQCAQAIVKGVEYYGIERDAILSKG